MRALLHYYGVELHNFNPNSIAQADIFAAVCEGFLGIDPHWNLWTHLFSVELFALTTRGKEGQHDGAGRWLHPPVKARAHAAVHPCHPCVLEQGVAAPVVLPPERRRKVPVVFSTTGDCRRQQLVLGATREKQEKLQPLLEALQRLRDGGLTATGVIAATHHRRVLPLAERRLPLSEMKLGVDLEGSQMSSASLSADDLRRRVAGTVGRLDASALTQPVMRPEHGYVSLVVSTPPVSRRVAFDSYHRDFRSSPGVAVLQALPATDPGGRGGPSRAEGRRGEEKGEGHGKGPGP
jgi:hypothetical protein